MGKQTKKSSSDSLVLTLWWLAFLLKPLFPLVLNLVTAAKWRWLVFKFPSTDVWQLILGRCRRNIWEQKLFPHLLVCKSTVNIEAHGKLHIPVCSLWHLYGMYRHVLMWWLHRSNAHHLHKVCVTVPRLGINQTYTRPNLKPSLFVTLPWLICLYSCLLSLDLYPLITSMPSSIFINHFPTNLFFQIYSSYLSSFFSL